MKKLLSSFFEEWFLINGSRNHQDTIFITSTDNATGRTIMIEENEYNVWVYLLRSDKGGIDFKGFLCTVINPKKNDASIQEKPVADTLLPSSIVNSFGYIKNIRKKHISIHWQPDYVSVLVKNKVYLIMDIVSKVSYSKGLAEDCEYGKCLEG